jgi:phage/plasmid-like protein (TIGR03299 family)
MAHELDQRKDGTYTMGRLEGTDQSWHGLEVVVPVNSSEETWLTASGMDFHIERSPVCFVDKNGLTHNMPTKHVLYRGDSHKPISTVSEGYNLVQPREVMGFFTDLCNQNKLVLNTAGVIKQSSRFWALASTGIKTTIGNTDVVKSYILIATSADGSMATTVKHTSIRVVCNNTLSLCLNNKEAAIRVPHSTFFNAEQVKMDLGLIENEFDEFAGMANEMHDWKVTDEVAKHWYAEFLAGKILDADEANKYANESRMFKNFYDGYKNGKGAEETMWGIINGVTYVVDHLRGRSNDTRMDSAMFGTGAALKAKAWKKALKEVVSTTDPVSV